MTIWEEYGISLEDYAKAFNQALDEEWEKVLKNNKVYLVNFICDKPRVSAIINIGEEYED